MIFPFVMSGVVGQFGLSGVVGVGSGHGEAALSATSNAHL